MKREVRIRLRLVPETQAEYVDYRFSLENKILSCGCGAKVATKFILRVNQSSIEELHGIADDDDFADIDSKLYTELYDNLQGKLAIKTKHLKNKVCWLI